MYSQFEKEQHLHGAGAAFELSEKIKRVFNKKYCILVNSATSAFEVICIGLNLKNKKIFTSCFNWPGALSPFLQHNNTFYFSQTNENLSIDSTFLPTEKLDIVLGVDFLGIAHKNQFELSKWAKKNNMLYITDASCSMGSQCTDGVSTGFFGDLIVTSFGPQKSFYGGEGGAILTDDELLFDKFIYVSEHHLRHISEGLKTNLFAFNFRMNPFGIEHLNRNFELYYNALRNRQTKGYFIYRNLKDNNLLLDNSPLYTSNNSTFQGIYLKVKKNNSIDISLCISEITLMPIQNHSTPSYLNILANSFNIGQSSCIKLSKIDLSC